MYKKLGEIVSQEDCDDLAVVLDDIATLARQYVIDAKEKWICEKAVEFKFIEKGASFDALKVKLRLLTKEEVTTNQENLGVLAGHNRSFITENCEAFCVAQRITVSITKPNAGFEKGKLCDLKKPQRNWSGHALYAKGVEAAKQVHKKIADCTKLGRAKAYVMTRVKREKNSGDDNTRKKRRKTNPLQVVDVNQLRCTNGTAIAPLHSGVDKTQKRRHALIERARLFTPELLDQIEAVIDGHQPGKYICGHCTFWYLFTSI
jgi:hypothetical protein